MARAIAEAPVLLALRNEALRAQLAADNAAVIAAQRLDAWANAVFPYAIGDIVAYDGERRARVVGWSGKMDGHRPCVVVTIKPIKKDGTDSAHYQRWWWWYPPEENA